MTVSTTGAILEAVLHYVSLGLASALLVGIWLAFEDLRRIVRDEAPAPRGRR